MSTRFFGGSFFGGEFFSTTSTTVVTKGFAGWKKHRPRDFTEERKAKEFLREQIRSAVEGPQAEVVKAAISEYIRPQKTDSRALTLDQRIDWDKIYRNMEIVEATVLMHIAIAEDDDDEDLLLLNS